MAKLGSSGSRSVVWLLSSEGLTEAEGPTSRVAHLHGAGLPTWGEF